MRQSLYQLALCLAVWGTACAGAEQRTFTADIPDDVDWLATVLLDANGTVINASGLVRDRRASFALEGFDRASTVHVLGFREADLAGFSLPNDAGLASARLREASPTDFLLPPPGWQAAGPVEPVGSRLETTPSGPELTTDWLPECIEFVPEGQIGHIDVRCPPGCASTAEQLGCTLFFDAPGCGLGKYDGDIDGRGNVHFRGAGLRTCRHVDASGPFEAAFDCDLTLNNDAACRFELHTQTLPSTLTVVESAELGTPTPIASSRNYILVMPGRLLGLELLNNRAAVGILDGDRPNSGCPSSNRNDRIGFLDLETLELVSSATIGPCLTALGRHPDGGLLAVRGAPGSQVLLHLDEAGRLLQSVSMPADDATDAGRFATTIVPVGDRVAILKRHAGDGGPNSEVLFFDPTDLTRAPVKSPTFDEKTFAAVPFELGQLAVLDAERDTISVVSPESGAIVEEFSLGLLCPLRDHLMTAMSFDPAEGFIVGGRTKFPEVTDTARLSRLTDFRLQEDVCPGGAFYAFGSIVHTWGRATPDRLILGVNSFEEGTPSALVEYDLVEDRFLPNWKPVADGPIMSAQKDEAGRLWFVLPTDAKVIRVDTK